MKFSTGTILLAVLLFSTGLSAGQGNPVDHWETIVYADDTFKYFVGTAEPPADWNELSFDGSNWLSGQGGIGYEDGDDNTILPEPTISLFLRKTFEIFDTSIIEQAILNIDYDDAYVAYLNGVEISRANIGTAGIPPPYDHPADAWREAEVYQGGIPERNIIYNSFLNENLVEGENLLAVQIHNSGIESSDLSSLVWFSVGVSMADQTYGTTPEWFVAPFEFGVSDLPLVIISTYGNSIPNEPKIVSFMGIIDNGPGELNRVTDSLNVYSGRIMIERRGQSSDYFYPKKSYTMETQDSLGENLNVSLLGMPEENDWILHGPYGDKSLIRNALTFHMAQLTGQYAPRFRYCDMILNGEYQGTYLFMEKIKRDNNRLPLATLLPSDTTGSEVTGGYILKIDKQDDIGPGDGWTSIPDPSLPGTGLTFLQYYYPETEDIHPLQQEYIQGYMRDFESALNGSDFTDPVKGYKKFIDMESFIDYFLVCELSKDVDNFLYSVYLFKSKDTDDGKLHMGPVWDNNLSYGNVDYAVDGAESPEGWLYTTTWRQYWFRRMMQDGEFRNRLKCRWTELRQWDFDIVNLLDFADSIAGLIDVSQTKNFQVWPILDTWVWPNNYIGGTYLNEYNFVIDFMIDRINWMDAYMPGNCIQTGLGGKEETIDPGVSVYPNPFAESLTLNYHLEDPGHVTIRILNLLGQELAGFHHPQMGTGFHTWNWDGSDRMGKRISPGIFLLILEIDGEQVFTEKIIKQ
ncbi:MAG: CotH kinase family protein [Bacteroidales bacterium]|nr:CotH kinase family protein [Bacteroidales bacterium]